MKVAGEHIPQEIPSSQPLLAALLSVLTEILQVKFDFRLNFFLPTGKLILTFLCLLGLGDKGN